MVTYLVPTYSSRSHVTGSYVMNLEGNLHTCLAIAEGLQYERITLLVPPKYRVENWEYLEAYVKLYPGEVILEECDAFGDNARATRYETAKWAKFCSKLTQFDNVLFAPQGLGTMLMCTPGRTRLNTCYLAYAINGLIGRLEVYNEYEFIDKILAERFYMVVATHDQAARYPKALNVVDKVQWFDKSRMEQIYDIVPTERLMPHTPLIFYPFRQTHKSYRTDIVYEALAQLYEEGHIFEFVYTAPNDIELPRSFPGYRLKPGKEAYYNMLANKPLIINFDSPDYILHYALYEHLAFGCTLLMQKNETIAPNAVIDESVESLKKVLLKFF